MKKAIFAVCFAMAASSVMAQKHVLIGAVHVTNPGAKVKVQMTIPYNAVFDDAELCRQAFDVAANGPVFVPVPYENDYTPFQHVVQLKCMPASNVQ